MAKIIQNGNPILRDIAKEVPAAEISSPKIKKILKDMSEALKNEKDGVAIAAPQIGVSLRIFIVSGKLFDIEKDIENANHQDLVFINPKITKTSKDGEKHEEGCLSVRGKYGIIKRATKATVRAYDENGKLFEYGGSGLLAKIFQHEIDHLNGILFIDKAENIYDAEK